MPLICSSDRLESSPTKQRNKRKSQEPKRLPSFEQTNDEQTSDGEDHAISPSPRLSSLSPGSSDCRSPSPISLPAKKRFKSDQVQSYHHRHNSSTRESENNKKTPCFRPWDDSTAAKSSSVVSSRLMFNPFLSFLPTHTLLNKKPETITSRNTITSNDTIINCQQQKISTERHNTSQATSSLTEPDPEQPLNLVIHKKNDYDEDEEKTSILSPGSSDQDSNNKDNTSKPSNRPKQRNYKNMTRERRIEANARERQRVQAITEVYETLRGVIPVEDKCSKLSKLSIIRIATGYINLLSRQCGMDYSPDQSNPSIEECHKRLQTLIRNEKNGQD